MSRINLYKLRLNPDTGQWERIAVEPFIELTPEKLAAMYVHKVALQELLDTYIDEHLEQTKKYELAQIVLQKYMLNKT